MRRCNGRIVCCWKCPPPAAPSAYTREHVFVPACGLRHHRSHEINHEVPERSVVLAASLVPSDQRSLFVGSANQARTDYTLYVIVELAPPHTSVHNCLISVIPTPVGAVRCCVKQQYDVSSQRQSVHSGSKRYCAPISHGYHC